MFHRDQAKGITVEVAMLPLSGSDLVLTATASLFDAFAHSLAQGRSKKQPKYKAILSRRGGETFYIPCIKLAGGMS